MMMTTDSSMLRFQPMNTNMAIVSAMLKEMVMMANMEMTMLPDVRSKMNKAMAIEAIRDEYVPVMS